MTRTDGDEKRIDLAGRRKDLLAAIVIAAFAIFAMILSARLQSPDTIYTHPGLLPFLTGLSLLAMAIALAVSAVRQVGVKALFPRRTAGEPGPLTNYEGLRTLLLIVIIAAYVILTDLITFDLRYPTRFFVIQFSSYEAVSIVILTTTLRIFWKAALWRCLLVSVVFVIALASVFRHGFHILLPGAN